MEFTEGEGSGYRCNQIQTVGGLGGGVDENSQKQIGAAPVVPLTSGKDGKMVDLQTTFFIPPLRRLRNGSIANQAAAPLRREG